MWNSRTALIFQLSYKQQTDRSLLGALILSHAASKEFFLQKAIGWALRQYARTDADWVREFVAGHALPKLSKREALKHLG
jgi:3-methyladenine DNA glycosylase AlkD